jgi:hypothetical protein
MQNIDEKLIKKIEALLNTNGCTEAEAEARMAKAQELLAKYNLDMAEIGREKPSGNARKDKTQNGGLYSWQRRLWKAVAEMNFCYYLSIKGLAKGSTYQHRVIGSHANVIATEVMAKYLQDVIEKLAQAWAKDNYYRSVFVREAIAYREGMTLRISGRLQERRDQLVAEERKKENERKQAQARTEADPGTTALTILDVISTEADFNNDYLNNWELGTTARKRVEQERRAKEWAAEYVRQQAAKTPEQKKREAEQIERWWAEQQEKEAKRQARLNRTPPKATRPRARTAEEKRQDLGSYWEGYDKGATVGIDQQVKDNAKKEALR